MPSPRYKLLSRHVRRLEKSLLPAPTILADPTTDLSRIDGIENRTAAFVVLCHAEFESYLEERSRTIAERGEFLWLRKKRITPCAFSLMAYYSAGEVPDKVLAVGHDKYGTSDLTPLLRSAVEQHITRITNNNGVKEKDVVAMVLPIGLRLASIPHSAVAELDAYGAQRGSIAHQHQSHRVRTALNVRDEKLRADRVLTELLPLDAVLSKLSV